MEERLPPAPWTQREDLAQLVAALGAVYMRWVGGAVRDTLLGMPVKDVDAATTHLPERVIELCTAKGIRTVPTGIEHGTVTAILPGGPVEVTTLRKDVATDGRRATIAFSGDWEEDAARRDFTINALYAHSETLAVSDYFGGLRDLSSRRVRFIGNPHERIREDHLRILRYFRFQARFGAELDTAAEAACSELADTLKGLSRERVAMELLNLLTLPDPAPTVARMRALGVLPVVLPEAGAHEIGELERLVAAEAREGIAPDPVRRLAALLPALPPVVETVAARLRLSRAQRDRLVCAAERKPSDAAAPHGLAYREGMACAFDRLLLAGAETSPLAGWQVPELPLKGGEIVARGVEAGPQVARMLRAVEARWVEEGFPDRTRVEAMLDEELARGN
ncbi:CCA tRNA nucleotidyltransferase [Parerythrobacter lacustris]|uniref:CCA tRNA nucleotidyltransferase n=1 Tax=Parerythrobacter lacustris TaxID=2969984 RepID=A0ABT1XUS4_9SPHN|nr:CCA tRNA nucleotidyltransferase [Parerythrobacter lacustris]MCR2834997.1 CCA tRNA nucleotidyltransferase [Parerythrobacter lacustris]